MQSRTGIGSRVAVHAAFDWLCKQVVIDRTREQISQAAQQLLVNVSFEAIGGEYYDARIRVTLL